MSGIALPAPKPRLRPLRGLRQRDARLDLPLKLAAFFALAAFCAAHYAVLVDDAPGDRVIGMVAAATVGGAALALTARIRGLQGLLLRMAIALATLAAALAVTGLEARLLLPEHWDALGAGLERGFGGLDDFTWPYDKDDPWVRLTLLLGMPALVAPAAILAFWPARRGAGLMRWLALVLLLVAYGTGVTQLSLDGWALRGSALLVIMAAWLWLPRLKPRDTLPATAAVLACGLLALPLAAGFDRDYPWIDYHNWEWFDRDGESTSFAWDHAYGPIDWSRSGVELLRVRSDEPHYWKAQTLDRFDGIRWLHSESKLKRGSPQLDIPNPPNPKWVEYAEFTVQDLRTPFLVGTGTTFRIGSSNATTQEPDGTIRVLDPPLEQDSDYEIGAYVPDPTAKQMRAASASYPPHLQEYAMFDLPTERDSGLDDGEPTAFERSRLTTEQTVRATGVDGALTAADEQRVLDSPYGSTYRLARRLASGQPTTFDTVKAVERYLQRGYQYSEKPPARRYPLPAFLFDDKIGYCQQFSGAMALLLRMNGIPVRVAAGFTPGTFDHQAREYSVRDFDAHSWVEVWFTGIGWVPFDPTPSAAPASSQSSSERAASAARGASADRGSTNPRGAREGFTAPAVADRGKEANDGSQTWLIALAAVLLVPLAFGAALLILIVRRAPRRRGPAHADGAVDELRSALRRLGYRYPARTTLSELERRLAVTNGPAAARYVRLLREQRYARPGSATGPTPKDRRELRRALTGGGPLARLRGLLALPPELIAR